MFPDAPNVDGLPPWLRIILSVAFALALIVGSWRSYRKTFDREPTGAAQTVLAAIPDMGALRHLADVCTRMTACIESLESSVREHTHHIRNQSDIDREVCARLREVKEVSEAIRDLLREAIKNS